MDTAGSIDYVVEEYPLKNFTSLLAADIMKHEHRELLTADPDRSCSCQHVEDRFFGPVQGYVAFSHSLLACLLAFYYCQYCPAYRTVQAGTAAARGITLMNAIQCFTRTFTNQDVASFCTGNTEHVTVDRHNLTLPVNKHGITRHSLHERIHQIPHQDVGPLFFKLRITGPFGRGKTGRFRSRQCLRYLHEFSCYRTELQPRLPSSSTTFFTSWARSRSHISSA